MAWHNGLPLWQHQICEVCYRHNKMFWPVWILKAKIAAFLLSQDTLSKIILVRDLVIIVSTLPTRLPPWAVIKIIFIISPAR
jgi:hypothetical protein